jgi:ABC-2 type transport system permease protein
MDSKAGFIAVFRREWIRIAHSKVCWWGIFGISIIALVVFICMMNSGLPSKIPIAVVDLDNTSTSRALIRQLDAFSKTDIKYKSLSFREARLLMERNAIYAILSIPENFARDAASGNQPLLVYYTNNAFFINGSLVFQDLKIITTLASASVGLQIGTAKGYTEGQLKPVLQPIAVEAHPLNNPWLNYSIYLNNVILPGILQIVILMFTISAFGSEIKSGTSRYLIALSENSTCKMMIGKLLPYTIIYIGLSLLYMSVLYKYSAFPLNSGFMPMFLNYICLILASQGLGVILLGIFHNYRFSISVGCLIGVLSIPISGFTYPVGAMSNIIQALCNLFPLRHFFLIYAAQGLNGYPIGYSAYHYAILLVFFALSILLWKRIRHAAEEGIYRP